ncbi:MAG: OsmC family protein [Acidobacteria bacterium]|nr:OsmC family protein [Acidobacteriota bacterium]
MDRHHFRTTVTWTGNRGTGTQDYRTYSRDHEIHGDGKSVIIPGSSAPAFRGDSSRYNPEELLVASLSECHMLWYLHLCCDSGVVVTAYADHAEGMMSLNADGSGEFREVVLRPLVTIADASRREEAAHLHERAHTLCFIARSVNFPVRHEPVIQSPA